MTSYTLKLIAIFAMLIDHVAYIFGTDFTGLFFPDSPAAASNMVQIMRIIGRLTFPIMAYFIAEGCRRTSSINKYMFRMLIFGVLAQIPYTLAFNASNRLSSATAAIGEAQGQFGTHLVFFGFEPMNVLFTLAFGILAIIIYEKLKRNILSYLLVIVIIVGAELLRLEYGAIGVIAVFVAYALPKKGLQLLGMGLVFSFLYLSGGYLQNVTDIINAQILFTDTIAYIFLRGIGLWLGAMTALVLIAFYNGRRGKKAKYMFYVFYPVHLLILAIIREMIRFI